MSDIKLEVYLYFPGNCNDAMNYYKEIFGGNLSVQTFGDSPADSVPGGINDDNKNLVMHAVLEGGDIKLMASDGSKASAEAKKIDLSLGGKNAGRLKEIFNGLAKDGTVHQELVTMFWGDTFGSLTDKYGVNWMVNIEQA